MTHPPAVQVQIPEAIASAVQIMIEPYGLDFNLLISQNNNNTPDTGGSGKKYLSVKEAVEYSSVSRYTLHRAVKAGELAVCKLCPGSKNGKILIPVENLNSWINRK